MFHVYADGNLIYQPLDETMILYSPKMTLDMGKAGSLEFMIPPNHQYYNQLHQLKTIITVELDDEEIFRGRVLSIKRNIHNIRTIYCEGNLSYLVDSVQKGEKYIGTTHDLFQRIVANHNARVENEKRFTIGTIGIENREVILTGQSEETANPDTGAFDYKQIAINSVSDNWQTSYDYIQTCLIDYCGGFLRTRRVGETTYLDILEKYDNVATQEIEFGVNLLDMEEEITSEELFTVLIPLGDENLTIASINNGSDELVDEKGVATYGRILKTHVFSNVNNPETLLENGLRFLASKTNIPATIVIKAVDLHLINPDIKEIHVGDIVHVSSSPHNLIDNLTCTKIEYDFENPANNTYTFGTPKQSLTERYREDVRKEKEENKRGRGGSGRGTGEAASEEAHKELDKLFDAYINVDKEHGTISLKTLYEELKDAKTVLRNEVGIDLDAPGNNLNLYNFHKEFDDLGNIVKAQSARIDLINDEHGAKIEMIAAVSKDLEEKESGHYAEFIMTADELKSAINMKADQIDIESMTLNLRTVASSVDQLKGEVNAATTNISTIFQKEEDLDGRIIQNEANITAVADATKSSIDLATQVDGKVAALTIEVKNNKSSINLKADKVTVNSKITAIESELTTLKNLQAKAITTDTISSYFDRSALTISDQIDAGRLRVRKDAQIGGNLNVSGTIMQFHQKVATEAWVNSAISDALKNFSVKWEKISNKPTAFYPKKHHHSFSFSKDLSNAHTHLVKIGTVQYRTGTMSANSTHKLSVNGSTDDYGG